jgi:hypothetical protein
VELSPTTVAEAQPVGTVVGTLSLPNFVSSGGFTFAFVAGDGDANNGSFTIDGSALKTAAIFDYETKNSYTIRVSGSDGGVTVERAFTITVTDVVELPQLAPAVAPFARRLNKNGTLNFWKTSDFAPAFSDPNNDSLAAIRVTTLPTKGYLRLGGIDVVVDQQVAAADLDRLTYTPNADYTGADALAYLGSDGTNWSALPATVSLTVAPTNEAPRFTSDPYGGDQGQAFPIDRPDGSRALEVVAKNGNALRYPLAGVDPNGDAITFLVVTAPASATIDTATTSTPTLVWQPSASDAGTHSTRLRVHRRPRPLRPRERPNRKRSGRRERVEPRAAIHERPARVRPCGSAIQLRCKRVGSGRRTTTSRNSTWSSIPMRASTRCT